MDIDSGEKAVVQENHHPDFLLFIPEQKLPQGFMTCHKVVIGECKYRNQKKVSGIFAT